MTNAPISETGEYIKIELLGILEIDIGKIIEPLEESREVLLAFMRVENISDHDWVWSSDQLRIYDQSNIMYEPGRLVFGDNHLPPGWFTESVEIEPGTKARVIQSIDGIDTVEDINKIVYKSNLHSGLSNPPSTKSTGDLLEEFERIELNITKESIEDLTEFPE